MNHSVKDHSPFRWLALAVLCMGNLMIILDGSIVIVALPSIQQALGITGENLSWIVNSYLIAFAGLMLFAGRLGDYVGRRRVFVSGLGIFTMASWLCGLADSFGMLVLYRFMQGIGGAMASAVVLGMVVQLFPQQRDQVKAIGVYSFSQAAGSSIGLIAGGLLTQNYGWDWIFRVNVPIGIAAVILTWALIPSQPRRRSHKNMDSPGALLLTAGLMLGVFAIVEAPEPHWGTLITMLMAAAAVVILVIFLWVEFRSNHPLIDLKIFRSRNVAGANLTMFLAIAGLFGFQFFTTLYLQQILGLNAMETGLAFIPAPLMIAVVSLCFSGWLNDRIGPTRVLPAGLAFIMFGLLWLSRVPSNGSYFIDILPALVVMGTGFGASVTVLMGRAMMVQSPEDAGLASGLMNTTQQLGAAIGTATLSALSTWRAKDLWGAGWSETHSLLGGYRLAYGVSAALLGVSILFALAFFRLRNHQKIVDSVG